MLAIEFDGIERGAMDSMIPYCLLDFDCTTELDSWERAVTAHVNERQLRGTTRHVSNARYGRKEAIARIFDGWKADIIRLS